ncbi:discoidin domain-containing protein [Tamlana sp. 2_MG-2023]|uniref:discoidin domain-containing protein n=1 Tax=unclassified Tamlana TaxID=2614803 RepID=UPI0026E25654|nr:MULTISPECIES: discoidin domain-containing protein [unclassified Tamlana]MDO6760356.1 discoidin domain-containing protein [Tamlana sp. 2_MG-2023]MDO6789946.1 discoidin domain-containing protein [Tamlana sp. 1_MG-2023]
MKHFLFNRVSLCAVFLGAFQFASAQIPSDLMSNCNQWKITYPDGVEDKTLCDEPNNEFFHVSDAGDALVFFAPVRSDNGTTPNSSYIRSELRERTESGNSDIYWTTDGSHMIYVKQAITHLPIVKSHLVATQIHGNKDDGIDDSMVMRLEGSHLFLSFNGGKLRDNVTIKSDYNLGDKHEVIFLVEDGKHYCYYSEDGNLLNAYNSGNASQYLVKDDGDEVLMDLNYDETYFKVGNYTQSNPEKEGDETDNPDNYGEVYVYDYAVVHGGGGVDPNPDPDPDPIAVSGVSLSPSSASLSLGSTQELSASVSPSDASNKSVSYSSSNTSVASVSSTGVVSGNSAGTATITVSTSDGNHTDTMEITVVAPSTDDNLALNKSVSGTGSADGDNVVANLVDGDTGSRWSVSGFPQSATIDLGSAFSLESTELVCYSDRAYQYTISVSDSENGSYTEVVNRSNNSTPGSASSPIIDTFNSINARYVKIEVTGADSYTGSWVSLLELRVFGGEGENGDDDNDGGDDNGSTEPQESTNVALEKSVSYSEEQSHNPAANLVDGDSDSRWSAEGYPEWVVVDLEGLYTINSTEVICFNDRAYQYTIEASTDGNNYTEIVDRTNNSTGGSNSNPIANAFSEIDARYVRITITGADDYSGDWASIEELRVFGYASSATSKSGISKNGEEATAAVKLWPNPAVNTVNISGAASFDTLTVYDQVGKVVLNQAIQGNSVDISSLNSGMYIFRLTGKDNAVTKRVIKN